MFTLNTLLNQFAKGFLNPSSYFLTPEQASIFLQRLHPVTLLYTDLQGRTLRLWKYNNLLIASLKEDGKIHFLSGSRIYNALQPTENGERLLHCLEKAGLRQ